MKFRRAALVTQHGLNIGIAGKKKIPHHGFHEGRPGLAWTGRIEQIQQRMLTQLRLSPIQKPRNTA
jgi:hypothetical protein